jgi:hypothetical protein
MDLTLKFDHQEVLAAIDPVYEGEVRILILTGETVDSIPIEGQDCIIIPPSLCIPDLVSPEEGEVMDNGRTDSQDSTIWEFDWSDCPGATAYHLYVMGSNATIPLINDMTLTDSYYRFAQTGYVADANRFGWTWKVGVKLDGMWIRWSETRSFDVEPVNTDPPLVARLSAGVVSEFSLGDNYPNPFNPTTRISYSLPVDCHVKLVVYNIKGQRVATLVDGYEGSGVKTVCWEARDVASGVYFYKLTTDKFTATKKMVLIK